MNRKLRVTLSAITSTAVASLALLSTAQAAPDKALDQMLDTCMQHFVANNLANYQGKVTLEKSDSSVPGYESPLALGRGHYSVTVTAVGRPGGVPLATATCRVGRDGSVISMKTMPLAALKKLHSDSAIVAKNEMK